MAYNDVNPGTFDTPVSLYTVIIGTDDEGAQTQTFSLSCMFNAKVELQAIEDVYDDNQRAKRTGTITCYKNAALTTRCRIKWGGVWYEITDIDPIERLSVYQRVSIKEL